MVMDGDWHEERPTLIDSSGWALNPECYYLNYLKPIMAKILSRRLCPMHRKQGYHDDRVEKWNYKR